MKTSRTILALVAVGAVALTAALAQAQSIEEAQTLVSEGKWKEAAMVYRSITQTQPDSGAAWYGLARALHEAGAHGEARTAYEKVLDLGQNPARARYHFARLSASLGEKEQALKLLREAQEAGMAAYQVLMQASEFETLHDNVSFQETANRMKPCGSPEYAHFDFWIGEWDVQTPQGQPAGKNRITRVQGGYVLLEEWTSAGGGTGTSFNTFNTQKRSWQQFWVDASGTVLEISGGLVDGAMVMSSDPKVSPINRITWTPREDGSVRQHWETSQDSGSSWATAFDGIYRLRME